MATKRVNASEPVMVEVPKEEVETFTVTDPLTTRSPEMQKAYNGPYVPVFIPALEDTGEGGMKVDQYEHVTIANANRETCYKVIRGETVEVPVPVFLVLKERYPKI